MFTSICEIFLSTLLRVKLVKNDKNKLYFDLRALNDQGYNTTNGLFIPAEYLTQLLSLIFTSSTPGIYNEYLLGEKNRLLLLKTDASTGGLTILLAKKPGGFHFTGLQLNRQEMDNLQNQSQYLQNTIQQHQQQYPPPAKKQSKSTPEQVIPLNTQLKDTYVSMPNFQSM